MQRFGRFGKNAAKAQSDGKTLKLLRLRQTPTKHKGRWIFCFAKRFHPALDNALEFLF